MTPIEFLYYKHPELKSVPINEVTHLLTGEAVLALMSDYAYHQQFEDKPFQPFQSFQSPQNPYPVVTPWHSCSYHPFGDFPPNAFPAPYIPVPTETGGRTPLLTNPVNFLDT